MDLPGEGEPSEWWWLPGLAGRRHSHGASPADCAACRPARFTWPSLLAAAALVAVPAGLSAWLGLKLHRRLLLAAARWVLLIRRGPS